MKIPHHLFGGEFFLLYICQRNFKLLIMSRISLNKCKKGDILISKHNKAFIYSHKDNTIPYPHVIFDALTEKKEHTRITSGHVFKNNRLETDDDIIKIISL